MRLGLVCRIDLFLLDSFFCFHSLLSEGALFGSTTGTTAYTVSLVDTTIFFLVFVI